MFCGIFMMNKIITISLLWFFSIVLAWCQKDLPPVEQNLQSSMYQADLSAITLVTDLSQIDKTLTQDAIDYFGKVILLSDFPVEKILDASYMEKLNQSVTLSEVWWSPENALVNLIIDKNGILYTPKRYNQEDEELRPKLKQLSDDGIEVDGEVLATLTPWRKEYLTDIETYRQVTWIPEATVEYTQVMPGASGDGIWSFDAYVKFFEKSEAYEMYRKR